MTTDTQEDAFVQKIRRITDVGNEPLEFLAAITGFEKKPIVSINKAIEPLVPLVEYVEMQTRAAKAMCNNSSIGDLSLDEAVSIKLYTMEWKPKSLYITLNETLRMKDRKKLVPWFFYLKLIFVALDRIPAIIGQRLFRGVREDLSSEYIPGKSIVWWGFSSCTISEDVLQSDLFFGSTGQRTKFIIDCNTGKNIKKYSYMSEEDEVLVLPATHFQIIQVTRPEQDVCEIYLKEIDSGAFRPALPELNERHRQLTTEIQQQLSNSEQKKLNLSKRCNNINDVQYITILLSDSKDITQLDFSHNNIYAEGAKYVTDALRAMPKVTEINLSGNKIGDEGAKYLADALRTMPNVTQPDLSWNEIGDEGAKHLADALRTMPNVTEISLSCNKISDEGVKYLADALRTMPNVTQINLSWNEIRNEGAKYLADALPTMPHVTEIDLSGNKIGDKGTNYLADALRTMPNATQLNLSWNKIRNEGAKYFADALRTMPNAAQLDLSWNKIGDEGAKYLADALRTMPNVTQLDLSWNKINVKGTKYLADALRTMSKVTEINLSGNKIGDEGAKYLADALRTMPNITQLDFSWNRIGDAGAKYLADALRTMSNVTQLDLRSNGIGDEGAKYLADALRTMPNVIQLDLSHNKIGDLGCVIMMEAVNAHVNVKTMSVELYDQKVAIDNAEISGLNRSSVTTEEPTGLGLVRRMIDSFGRD